MKFSSRGRSSYALKNKQLAKENSKHPYIVASQLNRSVEESRGAV